VNAGDEVVLHAGLFQSLVQRQMGTDARIGLNKALPDDKIWRGAAEQGGDQVLPKNLIPPHAFVRDGDAWQDIFHDGVHRILVRLELRGQFGIQLVDGPAY